jgi:hypothetical protein
VHQGSAAYDSHADPFLQDNAIRYRHDCQLCGEMGIYSRNAAVMPIFCVILGIITRFFLYMENEEFYKAQSQEASRYAKEHGESKVIDFYNEMFVRIKEIMIKG